MKNTKENNAKPKLRKALAVLIGILLFWNVIVRYLGYGLYARLYFLPRLSVSVNLTVDGEACRLERGDITGLTTADGVTLSRISFFRAENTGCTFRIKGGAYGSQPFEIMFQTDRMKAPAYLPVTVGVLNWYELADFDIRITVDTEKGTFSYTGDRFTGKGISRSGNAFRGEGTLHEESSVNQQIRNDVHVSGA